MERDLEEFVEDRVSDGRTPLEVWAVARATKWAGQAEEARRLAEEKLRPRKKVQKSS